MTITAGVLLVGLCLVFTPADACQLQYTGKAASMFGSTPRGSFSNLQACNAYRMSRPAFERNHSRCVNCSSSTGGGGGGSFQQQLTNGLLNSFMDGFTQGLQQQPTVNKINQAQKKAEQERKKAAWRAKVQKQLSEMEHSYAAKEQRDFKQKKSSLLAGLMGAQELSLGATDQSQALQQACLINLQLQTAGAMQRGDEQGLNHYRDLYEQVEQGDLSVCDQFQSALPEPTPSPAGDFRAEFYTNLLHEIDIRLPLIKQARQQKDATMALVETKEARVVALKEDEDPAIPAAEKQEMDSLLQAALKELEEAKELDKKADADLNLLHNEIEALREVGKIASKQP